MLGLEPLDVLAAAPDDVVEQLRGHLEHLLGLRVKVEKLDEALARALHRRRRAPDADGALVAFGDLHERTLRLLLNAVDRRARLAEQRALLLRVELERDLDAPLRLEQLLDEDRGLLHLVRGTRDREGRVGTSHVERASRLFLQLLDSHTLLADEQPLLLLVERLLEHAHLAERADELLRGLDALCRAAQHDGALRAAIHLGAHLALGLQARPPKRRREQLLQRLLRCEPHLDEIAEGEVELLCRLLAPLR